MQLCTVCRGDPNEPVCLDCGHVFCRSCLKQWLDTPNRTCPLCKQLVPENFKMVVSKEIRYFTVIFISYSLSRTGSVKIVAHAKSVSPGALVPSFSFLFGHRKKRKVFVSRPEGTNKNSKKLILFNNCTSLPKFKS